MDWQTAIVFLAYVAFFNWLITQIPFVKKSGLPQNWIVWLFSLKIIAGLFYAWFYLKPEYYANSDTWNYFKASKAETHWLLNDPRSFFKDLFTYGYQKSGNLFTNNNSYWNDLKNNVIIKLIAVCNVFTFKNYYANIVLFNFFYFFGPIAFYRLVSKIFTVKKLFLVITIFLIPSFLFWCSGIHKDGLIFSALALSAYYFHDLLQQRKLNFKNICVIVVCFILIFALRNSLFFLLIPAYFCWFCTEVYFKKRKLSCFITVYTCGLILFGISGCLNDELNLPLYFIKKQNEFKSLQGEQIALPPLQLSVSGFLKFVPYVFGNAFFQPNFTKIKNFSYVPATLENLFIVILILLCLIFKKRNLTSSSFLLFCLFFSTSVLFVIGYTITSPASIVRYKSLILPLLLTPLIVNVDMKYLKRWSKIFS